MKTNLKITSIALAICLALCSAAHAQSVNATARPTGGGGGGGSTPPPGTYSGRIVYCGSKGILHILNLATNIDSSTGVSGVNPKFSPDGKSIVFQHSGIEIMSSSSPYSPTQLSATGGTPSFDPTGTLIVYNDSGIWQMDTIGANKVQLTSSGQQPSYSADGSQIAYNNGAGQQLFIMNADGANAHQALTSSAVIDTVWAPGLKVVMGVTVGRNYQLSTYDPATPGSLTQLTFLSGNNFEPSWSPDGTHISWTSMGAGGIMIMNADGSNQRMVIPGGRQGSWGPP